MKSINSNKPGSSASPADRDEVEVKDLIRKIKAGNKKAFTRLFQMYRPQVASLAYKMVNDYDEAADITQAVFVKMTRNVWKYDEKKKFYTWLYRITVNASIDHIRKNRRHAHEPLEHYQESIESRSEGPEFSLRRQQIKEHITKATKSLNEKQRSAFVLRDIEGCKIDDVARIMNMPEATVRWYLHRARHHIKKELIRRCPQLLMVLGIR